MECGKRIDGYILTHYILPYAFNAQALVVGSLHSKTPLHLTVLRAISAQCALVAWAHIVLDYLEPDAFVHALTLPRDARKSAIAAYISEVLVESGLYIRIFLKHEFDVNARTRVVQMGVHGLNCALACLRRWAPHRLTHVLRLRIPTTYCYHMHINCVDGSDVVGFATLMQVCTTYAFLPVEVELDWPNSTESIRNMLGLLPPSVRSLTIPRPEVSARDILTVPYTIPHIASLTRLHLNMVTMSWNAFALPTTLTDLTLEHVSLRRQIDAPVQFPPQLRRLELIGCAHTPTTLALLPTMLHTLILRVHNPFKDHGMLNPLEYVSILPTNLTYLHWHAIYNPYAVAKLPATLRTLDWTAHKFENAQTLDLTSQVDAILSNTLFVLPPRLTTLHVTYMNVPKLFDFEYMLACQLPATLTDLHLTIPPHAKLCGQYFANASHGYLNLRVLHANSYAIADAEDALYLPRSLASLTLCTTHLPRHTKTTSKMCALWIANLPTELTYLMLNMDNAVLHDTAFAVLPRGLTHLRLHAHFKWYDNALFQYLPRTLVSLWLEIDFAWTVIKTTALQVSYLPHTLEFMRLDGCTAHIKIATRKENQSVIDRHISHTAFSEMD